MENPVVKSESGNRVMPTLSRLAFSMRPTSEVLVPRPRYPFPNDGLPIWKFMSLAQKIPVYPAPPGAVVFSRDMLGKSLHRKKPPGAPFQVEDRWLREMPAYDPLHDPNLRRLLYRPDVREFLEKNNLATESGHAICRVKEFNKQRLVLKRLHLAKIQKERAELDALDQERRFLTIASRAEDVRMNRIRNSMLKEQRFKLRKEELEEKHKELVRTCTQRRLQDERRYEELKEYRRNMWEARMNVGKRMFALNQRKYNRLRFEEERKRLQALVKWILDDRLREERKKETIELKKMNKEMELADWWDRKKEMQLERLEREQDMLEDAERELRERAWQREERITRGIARSRETFLEKQEELRELKRIQKEREMCKRRASHVLTHDVGDGTCDIYESMWDVETCLRNLVEGLTDRLHRRHEKDILNTKIKAAKEDLKEEIKEKIETRNFVRSLLENICNAVDTNRLRQTLQSTLKKLVERASEAYIRTQFRKDKKKMAEKKQQMSQKVGEKASKLSLDLKDSSQDKKPRSRSPSPSAEDLANEYDSDIIQQVEQSKMSSATVHWGKDVVVRIAADLRRLLGKHVLIIVIEAAKGKRTLQKVSGEKNVINGVVNTLLPAFVKAVKQNDEIRDLSTIERIAPTLASLAYTEAQEVGSDTHDSKATK